MLCALIIQDSNWMLDTSQRQGCQVLQHIHHLWLLYQITTNLPGKAIQICYLIYLCGGQKSNMGLSGLKSSCQGCVLSGGYRKEQTSLPFPAYRGHTHSLVYGLFLHLQNSSRAYSNFFASDLPASLLQGPL